jgi:intraflagellar transport protein 52
VVQVITRWLTRDEASPVLEPPAAECEEPELAEYAQLPDAQNLAERLQACLDDGEGAATELAARGDAMSLFDTSPFKLDTSLIPEAKRLYDELGIERELPLPLLIAPRLEQPLPPLAPATFPPSFVEPPPPPLELFDLEEDFLHDSVRTHLVTCTVPARQPLPSCRETRARRARTLHARNAPPHLTGRTDSDS